MEDPSSVGYTYTCMCTYTYTSAHTHAHIMHTIQNTARGLRTHNHSGPTRENGGGGFFERTGEGACENPPQADTEGESSTRVTSSPGFGGATSGRSHPRRPLGAGGAGAAAGAAAAAVAAAAAAAALPPLPRRVLPVLMPSGADGLGAASPELSSVEGVPWGCCKGAAAKGDTGRAHMSKTRMYSIWVLGHGRGL